MNIEYTDHCVIEKQRISVKVLSSDRLSEYNEYMFIKLYLLWLYPHKIRSNGYLNKKSNQYIFAKRRRALLVSWINSNGSCLSVPGIEYEALGSCHFEFWHEPSASYSMPRKDKQLPFEFIQLTRSAWHF